MDKNICPKCGCDPTKEPYCMEPTHCPMCGYIFPYKMSPERVKELYDNMLEYISELVSPCDLINTLHVIGFTDEEIKYESFNIKED